VRKQQPLIEVRDSGIQGKGVWAVARIPRGTWIIEYTGERITHEEADRRYDDEAMDRHHTFLFTVDEKICIDAVKDGNDARFINHSCDPNCEAILSGKKIWIGAMRDIEAGEELSYDYGYHLEDETMDEAVRKYPCHCGAKNCRGTILKLSNA
jgi:SET domain-containing protein